MAGRAPEARAALTEALAHLAPSLGDDHRDTREARQLLELAALSPQP